MSFLGVVVVVGVGVGVGVVVFFSVLRFLVFGILYVSHKTVTAW